MLTYEHATTFRFKKGHTFQLGEAAILGPDGVAVRAVPVARSRLRRVKLAPSNHENGWMLQWFNLVSDYQPTQDINEAFIYNQRGTPLMMLREQKYLDNAVVF